ncbi:electron transport complex subunit RsxB [Pandoraea nosoerga]|uniref:Ferredoxin n=1 Tax=Pandoraea nosoerga TaxID=2508296 RepID=A0A5E4TSV4_9BURK|nr:electron transport complex subunit RsxB [Pandoraea nosoerga]MBN4668241.1 electron transport complex subunit RsxB [Pandoraea nosoerga]MBN4675106.1 electron transport complex subunit RsxB [Pandoraea nosoerga]MBN4680423.1 electron transport complex subunit RsxB [Pandoraea nosoerga]MBN4745499.1 electron transport complex subunit RsxB [Pandoraea nosoerga]VVD89119.1 ferredoxin [Pandoraea nosoerga]
MSEVSALAQRIDALLPQTQCTKCGYAGCRPYADAIASAQASYNQCPPGGAQGVARLAGLLGRPVIPLNPENGAERPRPRAVIDESLCIGCTLCLQACPVDAIVGAAKLMHTVIEDRCTGCDLCVPPCPVDCIDMVPVTGERTGWDAWTQAQADQARAHYEAHLARLARDKAEREARLAARAARVAPVAPSSPPSASAAPAPGGEPPAAAVKTAGIAADLASTAPVGVAHDEAAAAAARKQAIIQAALERARQKKAALAAQGLGPKNTENVSADVQAQIDEAEARRKRLGLTKP